MVMLSITSCDRIIDYYLDENKRRKDIDNYTSPYMGSWSGIYVGDEAGVFTIEINKGGYVKASRTSDEGFNESFEIGQVLHDGSLQGVYTGYSKFRLFGSLVYKKGTWEQQGKKGTWTIIKE